MANSRSPFYQPFEGICTGHESTLADRAALFHRQSLIYASNLQAPSVGQPHAGFLLCELYASVSVTSEELTWPNKLACDA